MKNVSVWSRSRLFLPGAGADPSRSEPESAPGPWPPGAGAAQKSGSSATLLIRVKGFIRQLWKLLTFTAMKMDGRIFKNLILSLSPLSSNETSGTGAAKWGHPDFVF